MGLEFDTEKGDDLETIKQRLAEAAAWFEMAGRGHEGGFPRSERFHPSHFDHRTRKWIVGSIADQRKWAVKDHPVSSSQIEGRLLRYSPDETVADGASEAVSHGFFNVEDEPPWDLWLGWVVDKKDRPYEYLVCWIPPMFVNTVQDGIDVNPVDCFNWFPELEQALGLGPSSGA